MEPLYFGGHPKQCKIVRTHVLREWTLADGRVAQECREEACLKAAGHEGPCSHDGHSTAEIMAVADALDWGPFNDVC